jgi:ribulose-phosphate 3-epimerase
MAGCCPQPGNFFLTAVENILTDLDLSPDYELKPWLWRAAVLSHSSLDEDQALKTNDSYPAQTRSWLQVDGGINREWSKAVVEAGADVLVAGSYLFSAENHSR